MNESSEFKIKHKPFKPEQGVIYTNHNGFQYKCLWVSEDTAVFRSLGGWIFTAHHLVMYEDNTIEWGYSTGGHFERVGGEQICV